MKGREERRRSHDILFYSVLTVCLVAVILKYTFGGVVRDVSYLMTGVGALALILVVVFTGVPRPGTTGSLSLSFAQFITKHLLLVFMVLAQAVMAVVVISLLSSGRFDLSALEFIFMVLFYEVTVFLLLLAGKYLGRYLVSSQGNRIPDEQASES